MIPGAPGYFLQTGSRSEKIAIFRKFSVTAIWKKYCYHKLVCRLGVDLHWCGVEWCLRQAYVILLVKNVCINVLL